MKKIIIYIVIAVIVLVGLAGLREILGRKAAEQSDSGNTYAAALGEEDPLVQRFMAGNSDEEIILAFSDDVNADGTPDLIAIVRGDEMNHTIAMISENRDYFFTEPVPAPRENQKVKFINIDKDDDLEVMITGEKNGQVGYAVFKMMKGRFKDLYGENMKDCC
jgi:hypothetical protein